MNSELDFACDLITVFCPLLTESARCSTVSMFLHWQEIYLFHRVYGPPYLCSTMSVFHRVYVSPYLYSLPVFHHWIQNHLYSQRQVHRVALASKKKKNVCVWGEGGGQQCNAQSLSGKTRGGDISTHSDYNSTPCSTLLLFLEMKLKNESWEDGEHSRAYRSLQDHSM